MDISRVFTVEAAHQLPNVPRGHKCGRLHGHSFKIEIYVSGPVGAETGWITDFADLQKIFQPIYDKLDHSYLNEIEGLQNPTCENLVRWIWASLKPLLPHLSRIAVHETPQTSCVYAGEDC